MNSSSSWGPSSGGRGAGTLVNFYIFSLSYLKLFAANGNCFNCGQPGHRKADCPAPIQQQPDGFRLKRRLDVMKEIVISPIIFSEALRVETASIVASLDIAKWIAQALPLESLPTPLPSLVAFALQAQVVPASTAARLLATAMPRSS